MRKVAPKALEAATFQKVKKIVKERVGITIPRAVYIPVPMGHKST